MCVRVFISAFLSLHRVVNGRPNNNNNNKNAARDLVCALSAIAFSFKFSILHGHRTNDYDLFVVFSVLSSLSLFNYYFRKTTLCIDRVEGGIRK